MPPVCLTLRHAKRLLCFCPPCTTPWVILNRSQEFTVRPLSVWRNSSRSLASNVGMLKSYTRHAVLVLFFSDEILTLDVRVKRLNPRDEESRDAFVHSLLEELLALHPDSCSHPTHPVAVSDEQVDKQAVFKRFFWRTLSITRSCDDLMALWTLRWRCPWQLAVTLLKPGWMSAVLPPSTFEQRLN